MMRQLGSLLWILTASAFLWAQQSLNPAPPLGVSGGSAPSTSDPVLVGAGDIASCDDLSGAVATAKLLDKIPGTVFALGDLAYPDGTDDQFTKCYGPTWGRHKNRTRPAPGNHEYHSDGASGYARYFGIPPAEASKGYYSYDLGAWHIVVLNSECLQAGGCDQGSPQEKWLKQDLAAHPATCTLAYWHRPLFSSGAGHGNAPEVKQFWDDLYEANADVVLGGHDHDYERFAPQDPAGERDSLRGIREFVVGTGGKNTHRSFSIPRPNSEIRQADAYGVLKLTLHPTSYEWAFVAQEGKTFTDSGTATCH
jgi:acid phosphatase type 7